MGENVEVSFAISFVSDSIPILASRWLDAKTQVIVVVQDVADYSSEMAWTSLHPIG